jgi:hypothetical protein
MSDQGRLHLELLRSRDAAPPPSDVYPLATTFLQDDLWM